MKILLVHNRYRERGGEDTVFEQECGMLQDAGHDVTAYSRSNSEIEGCSLIQRAKLLTRISWSLESKRDFSNVLATIRPDLVHVHNFFLMISPSIFGACREMDIPVVQTLHNYRLLCPASAFFRDGKICEECSTAGLWSSVRHGCYHKSRSSTALVALMVSSNNKRHTWTTMVDRYIALTEFARSKFIEGGLPARKISVKPNCVGIDPGVRIGPGEYAVFVGRLSAEKGLSTLLAAWGLLGNKIPLHIIGDGPQASELRDQAARLRLTSVLFRGRLSHEESIAAIKRATLLIFPSECYENFPATLAEAFSCGVPVLTSRLGAMQEIVKHRETGLHFQAANHQELAANVEWAWLHENDMEAMGRRARAEYEAKYAAPLNYKMLMDIYLRSISDRESANT